MNFEEAIKALVDDGRIYDQEAKTLEELMPYFNGKKRTTVRDKMLAAIEAGTWEQVWKRQNNRTVKAFRPVAK